MPFDATIRTQLAKARTLLIQNGLMVDVQWRQQSATPDETGRMQHDAPVVIKAIVEDADARVLRDHGIDTPVRAKLTILDPTDCRAGDLFILPGNRSHPAVRVEPSVLDSTGTRFLTEVWLG